MFPISRRTERLRSVAWLSLTLAISGCVGSKGPRPLGDATATADVRIVAGDVLSIQFDEWFRERAQVAADGSLTIAECPGLQVQALSTSAIAKRLSECMVTSGVHSKAQDVVVSVSSRVIVRVGSGARVVPTDGALVQALLVALVIPPGKMPDSVTLFRGGARYPVNPRAEIAGNGEAEAGQPLVAKHGDEVVVSDDYVLRPQITERSARSLAAIPVADGGCDSLSKQASTVQRAGAGQRHPYLLSVREAHSRCRKTWEDELTADECRLAFSELTTFLGEGKRDHHPDVRERRAMLSRWPKPASASASCAALRARESALVAAGKGPNHSELRGVRLELKSCSAE